MNEPRLHRFPTPFAAFEQIRRLACFTYDKNLIPVFASTNIKNFAISDSGGAVCLCVQI